MTMTDSAGMTMWKLVTGDYPRSRRAARMHQSAASWHLSPSHIHKAASASNIGVILLQFAQLCAKMSGALAGKSLARRKGRGGADCRAGRGARADLAGGVGLHAEQPRSKPKPALVAVLPYCQGHSFASEHATLRHGC